ncbi:hypothetical protein WOLCODRAFT_136703 [Wolfiporia cocos MD-104 SS10]|uniref:Uncharacterized protein n=1 Tax=Wolfiporia cocos (strain MD-104) TaxID=742152 RepID=A0A2H3JD43_WOLCO|nr:hypothetical protein WOLCODRAFT_136703 [Wolfiporia cocos MD-104 SS10]
MGFFSSRRPEHQETNLHDENAVVRVIRSRFYGKSKGKEREHDSDSASYPNSSPSLPSSHVHSREKHSFPSEFGKAPGEPRQLGTHAATVTTATRARYSQNVQEISSPRSSADILTISLAQRLNELATANSEGLLSDDEYRVLRQSLFERFAGGSAVPSEAPVVPISGGARSHGNGRMLATSLHDRRPSSQYHVQSSRASSVTSKRSVGSSVTSLLRRATSIRGAASPIDASGSDSNSVFSMGSTADRHSMIPRSMSGQLSDPSLRGGSASVESLSAKALSISRGRKRSGSNAPPSAYPGSPTLSSSSGVPESLADDDTLETSKELRAQIELVEAEGRRLLDAFNGLELSTLTRGHRRPHARPPISISASQEGISTHSTERRSTRSIKDTDMLSFQSGGSLHTTPSTKRPSSTHRIMPAGAPPATPRTMSRKGSMSSMSSRGKSGLSGVPVNYGLGSSSSINLAKSSGHLPLATVRELETPQLGHYASATEESDWTASSSVRSGPEGSTEEDEDIKALETELADIRRRRTEVTARYEARLEYLRARLKGAELREKLLRK